jgi:FkbM family methyltransferase
MKTQLLESINKVESLAKASKVARLLANPLKYVWAISFKEFRYPKHQKEKLVDATLFYGKKMKIALPASTDIYLTGGKSHSSEIRLAKFLILNLEGAKHFLDIGAHYGYFTLLVSELIDANGKIMSFEPAGKTYRILKENTMALENVTIAQKAISASDKKLVFYEFPNLQSEYNTSDIAQFEKEDWYQNAKPEKVEVEATTIDIITRDKTFLPDVIKIDVEGAEYDVIQGGLQFFNHYSPKIVIEYLAAYRGNESHKKALTLLQSIGYDPYIIIANGTVEPIKDIDGYLAKEKMESDNIVFMKHLS